MAQNMLKTTIFLMNNGKFSTLSDIVTPKNLVITSLLVKTVVKNILALILVVTDTVQCAKTMLVKNGFKNNLVIY